MYNIDINTVVPGYTIANSITLEDGTCYSVGTVLTNTIINKLQSLGIQEVCVNPIISDDIDARLMDKGFESLNHVTLATIQNGGYNAITTTARLLIRSIKNSGELQPLIGLYLNDEATCMHSVNVAVMATAYAISSNLSQKEITDLAIGGLLHDVGKYKISNRILNKESKLDEDELFDIRLHPGIGYGLLIATDVSERVRTIVVQHHEDWNGSGYPSGLHDLQVNKLARIIHIIDVYEAMCAQRSYKESIPRALVRKLLMQNSGTKFDPFILQDILCKLPLYMIGDEIMNDKLVGVVTNVIGVEDISVIVSNMPLSLIEFERL